jgi:phosphoribosylamine---glycine ligase
MHILVVGRGGRAHALAWKLAQSPRVTRISVAPGNGGTDCMPDAENVDIDATDVVSLLDFAETEGVDLTVVGPEEPLAGGLVDQFAAVGLRIFGPSRQAALIETYKSHAKDLMQRYGVPTPPATLFTELDDARRHLMMHPVDEIVIKADGLAKGKGVFLPRGGADAEGILRALLERDALGRAGRRVMIEERLSGHELSVMAFADGQSVAMLPALRDYWRLHERGVGPNTGGMGAYAPAPRLIPPLAAQVRERIIEPVLEGLRADGHPFRGVLNVGIMLTREGPMALDLNARIGDPGAQTVLPLLATDLVDVLEACADGTLDRLDVCWHDRTAVSVVMATAGYPDRTDPGLPVQGLDALPGDVLTFHAGTRYEEGRCVTTGGRVLALTGTGPDLAAAMQSAYRAAERVRFEGVQYRTDIGKGALAL